MGLSNLASPVPEPRVATDQELLRASCVALARRVLVAQAGRLAPALGHGVEEADGPTVWAHEQAVSSAVPVAFQAVPSVVAQGTVPSAVELLSKEVAVATLPGWTDLA